MTTNTNTIAPGNEQERQSARTDDLLVGGADAEDGARGFTGKADPQDLQTGMEGIADAAVSEGNRQSDHDQVATTRTTLPDNAQSTRNK